MTNTEIAAIWCRISTVGQGELSPESQEDRVRQVLEARGFEVPSHYVFKVEWSSLDLESCPEFRQLRKLILETDKLDYINDMVDCLDVMERVEALLPATLKRP